MAMTEAVALQVRQVWGRGDRRSRRATTSGDMEPRPTSRSRRNGPNRDRKVLGEGKGQRWSDKWQSDSMAHKDGAQLDESTLHLLRILTKMTLRLEEEVGRYRADTGFMLFVDTLTEQNTLQLLRDAAQEWQKSFEEGTVKSSLRMQVKDDRPPLAQDQVMHHVETLMRVGTSPTTLPRLKTLHKLGVETPNTKVVPFKISVSLRGPEAQSMFEALTALSWSPETPRPSTSPRTYAEDSAGDRARECVLEHKLHGLDSTQSTVGAELQEGRLGPVMHRPSPLPVELCLQLPTFCTPRIAAGMLWGGTAQASDA